MSKKGQAPRKVWRVDLPLFNLNQLDLLGTVMLVGPTKSGKSTVMKHILHDLGKYFYVMYGVAETDPSREFMESYTMGSHIYSTPNDESFGAILESQKSSVQDLIIKARQNGLRKEERERRLALVVADDVFKDPSQISKSKAVSDLLKQGRHRDILFLLACQVAREFPKSLRSQVTTIFFCRDFSPEGIRALHEMFFKNIIKSEADFMSFFDKATKDHNVLVIHKGSKKVSHERKSGKEPKFTFENLYRFKATEKLKSYRIGHPGLWYIYYARMRNDKLANEEALERQKEEAREWFPSSSKEDKEEFEKNKKRCKNKQKGGVSRSENVVVQEYDPTTTRKAADFEVVTQIPSSLGAAFRKRPKYKKVKK